MTILRCTNKVLKEFGRKKPALAEVPGNVSSMDEWYVNLFRLNRRKCLLFANAGTLFSFVAVGVARKDIQNLPELFRKELSKALFYEEFSAGEIQKVMKQVDTITIAKACNRSVLGSMNQMLFEYEHTVYRHQYFEDKELIEANRDLNRSLRSAIGEGRNDYGVPIEEFKKKLVLP